MNRKNIIICILSFICILIIFVGCSKKEKAKTVSENLQQNSHSLAESKDIPENTIEQEDTAIEKENLSNLIVKDNEIIPGEELDWYMNKDDFFDGLYGSELIDPTSEKFDEYRVGDMPNGMVSYSPPVEVTLKQYGIQMDTTFVFDTEEQLVKALYRAMFPVSEIDTYIILLNNFVDEADSISLLETESSDLRNLSEQNILENPLTLKWNCKNDSCYFQINSVNFQDTIIMDLILSIDSY